MVANVLGENGDPCSKENMYRLLGEQSVGVIIYESPLRDMIEHIRIKSARSEISRERVIRSAEQACRGSPFPPIWVELGDGIGRIYDGHHRFVASRLLNIPVIATTRGNPESTLYGRFHEWTEMKFY